MNNESRTLNSIRNIATGFLGQFISIILSFINRTIFIKFLASEYLGVNGLFSNILSMLSLAELGVGSAIIFALYKPLSEKDEIKTSKLMNFYSKAYISIGIVISLIGISLLPFLQYIIRGTLNIKEDIYILYLIYLFNTSITYFFSYKNSLIVADQKNYIASLINYGISVVQTILQIIVLVLTKNFIIYLIVQSICSLSYNIMISKTADKIYPYIKENKGLKLDETERDSLVSNIKALMIVKLSGVLVNNTDNIIITYFSGLSAVGLCSNYTMLISIINSVLAQIFNGITASVGNLNAKESLEKKEEFFNIINFCNFWLFGFSAIGIIILINDIVLVWAGENYLLPTSISVILAINFYMVGMQNAVWTYKNTMGIFREGRYLLLVTASINLILSMILGKHMGLLGILVSTAISRLFTNTWYDPYIVYKKGFNKSSKSYFIKYIKYIFILISILLITGYLCSLVKLNMIMSLVVKFTICLLVPNLSILILFYNTKEMKYICGVFSRIINKNKIIELVK